MRNNIVRKNSSEVTTAPNQNPQPTFSCHQCGQCCQGRGGVRLNQDEARQVGEYLQNPENFNNLYLEPNPVSPIFPKSQKIKRTDIIPVSPSPAHNIRTGSDGFCIFHRPNGQCLIHPVKPEACRTWPFFLSLLNHEQAFREAQTACPGLAEFSSWNDFQRARK